MLEIIVVVVLYRRLKERLKKKGRGSGLAWLGPGLWFAGEFTGAFVGVVIAVAQNREPGPETYLFALGGAVLGAFIAFAIVASQQALSYMCPSCGGEFHANPDLLGKSTCPHCGAKLRISGGMVYEAGKRKDS